jgi:hypothetical protein
MADLRREANVMEIKPISKTDAPSYPSADTADAVALLAEHVPQRWRRAKGLAGAVAVALAANFAGGCGSSADSNSLPPPLPSNPWVRPSPSLAEASHWVRSIYGKPQSQVLIMGDYAIPTPQIREEEVKVLIPFEKDTSEPQK